MPLLTLASENIINVPKPLFKGYLNEIFKRDLKAGGIDFNVWQHNFTQLDAAIQNGWGKPFSGIAYNVPDWKYLAQLKYHTASFAAFKNHQETANIVKLLFNDDGDARSWNDFKKAALPLTEEYNQRWLQAEYNRAQRSARMAAKWQDYEQESNLYPNLQYVAVNDERTREDHKQLDGLIYPVGHAFWGTHYPPNGWNCRCTVRQTDAAANMIDEPINPDEGFNNNTGKSGRIFESEHSYYSGVGAKDKAKIDRLTQKYVAQKSRADLLDYFKDKSRVLDFKILDKRVAFGLQHVAPIVEGSASNEYFRNLLLYQIQAVARDAKVKAVLKGNAKYSEIYQFSLSALPDYTLEVGKLKTGQYELFKVSN